MAEAKLQVVIEAQDRATQRLRNLQIQLDRMNTSLNRLGRGFAVFGGALAFALTKAVAGTVEGKEALDRLGKSTQQVQLAIAGVLTPTINRLVEALQPVAKGIADWITQHPELVRLVAVAAVAVAGLGAAFFLLGQAISVASGIVGILQVFALLNKAALALTIRLLPLIGVVAAMAATFILAHDAATLLFRRLGLIPKDTPTILERGWNMAKRLKDEFLDMIDPLVNLGDTFSSVFGEAAMKVTALSGSMRTLAQDTEAWAAAARDALQAAGFVGPTPFGFVAEANAPERDRFFVPGLQHGGIVRRPTLAMVGEAGPEAVIPLGRGSGGRGGGTPAINVFVQVDGRTIASVLGARAVLSEQVRSS